MLSLCISCSSRTTNRHESLNDSVEEYYERVVDSLPADTLDVVDFMYCPDSVRIKISNPYSDNIELNGEYSIRQVNADTLVLHESFQKIIIPAHSSYTFDVSLGMDSIWYEKHTTYLFTFPGTSKDKEVIYYKSLSSLGYVHRKKGQFYLQPDSIILPVAVYQDPDLEPEHSGPVPPNIEISSELANLDSTATEDSSE